MTQQSRVNPWAERLAVALKKWYEKEKKEGRFRTTEDLRKILKCSSGTFENLFRGFMIGHRLEDTATYAAIYQLTGLSEADPRLVPDQHKFRRIVRRAWTEEEYQEWLVNNAAPLQKETDLTFIVPKPDASPVHEIQQTVPAPAPTGYFASLGGSLDLIIAAIGTQISNQIPVDRIVQKVDDIQRAQSSAQELVVRMLQQMENELGEIKKSQGTMNTPNYLRSLLEEESTITVTLQEGPRHRRVEFGLSKCIEILEPFMLPDQSADREWLLKHFARQIGRLYVIFGILASPPNEREVQLQNWQKIRYGGQK